MKKIFIIGMACFCCSAVFAAFQFEYSATGNISGGMAEYTIKVTEGTGSIYVGKGTLKEGYTMGWYDISTGFTGLTNEGFVTQDSTGKNRYSLGEFSAGDEVGIWFKFEDIIKGGSVLATSTGEAQGGVVDAYGDVSGIMLDRYSRSSDTSDASGVFGYGVAFTFNGKEYTSQYGQIAFGLDGEERASGQPLPGIFAALAFGGAVLAHRRRKQA